MIPAQTSTGAATESESKPKANALSGNAVKYCWQLSKSVMADVVITGPEISAKDIEMLRKYLELTKDALGDQQQKELL